MSMTGHCCNHDKSKNIQSIFMVSCKFHFKFFTQETLIAFRVGFKVEILQHSLACTLVTSTVIESKDDPTQMTKAVIYNYILYYIQKTIHSKHICKNVHS